MVEQTPQTTPTSSDSGDPSGVPRPLAPDRVDKAKANSGIMIGEVPTTTKTTTGADQDQYKTAFVKVYQDAGVIGVAMLTLLALCVVLAIFSVRILKMYSTLVAANNALVQLSADATVKMATAMTLFQAEFKAAIAEIRRESDDTGAELRRLHSSFEKFEDKVTFVYRETIASGRKDTKS